MCLKLICLLVWAPVLLAASTMEETDEPTTARPPMFAHPGETVTLQCGAPPSFHLSSDLALEWIHLCGSEQISVFVQRGGDVLRKDVHDRYRARSTLTGEHDLTLHGVQIQDNGTLSCIIRKGPTVLHQEFIHLIIVEVSEVNITTWRSPNELLVVCESTGWNPKPLVSLVESNGNKLHAHVDFTLGLDGLYGFSATLTVNTSKGMLTGDGTIICNAEIPDIGLVKGQSAFIEDVSRFQEAGFDLMIFWAVVTAVVMTAVMFCFRKFLIWKFNKKMAERARLEGPGETDEESKEDEDDEHAEVLWADLVKVGAVMFAWGAPLFGIAGRRAKGKVHGDIMEMKTKGAIGTARASGLTITGVKASQVLAGRTLENLMKLRKRIVHVAQEHHVHPALVGGIISCQSQAGTGLDRDGRSPLNPGCFGLLQIRTADLQVDGGPLSREHLDQGVAYLCELLDFMKKTKEGEGWTEEQLLRGALVCFKVGKEAVAGLAPEDLDGATPHGDFADDVIARAQWLARNGL